MKKRLFVLVAVLVVVSALSIAAVTPQYDQIRRIRTLYYSLAYGSGLLQTAASTTERAGLRVLPGVAPTTPVNGDIWTTAVGLYVRVNDTTLGPFEDSAGLAEAIAAAFADGDPLTVDSVTSLGLIQCPAGTSALTGFNIPNGAANAAPTEGDVYGTTSGLYRYDGSGWDGPFLDAAGVAALLAGSTLPASVTTMTASALVSCPAGTSGLTGFRIPNGAANAAPTEGDVYGTTSGLYRYDGSGWDGPFLDSVAVASLLAGGTLPFSGTTVSASGLITAPAGTTEGAGLKITAGVDPTTPALGYVWIKSGSGMYVGMGTDTALTKGPLVDAADVAAVLAGGTLPFSGTTGSFSGLVTAPAGNTAQAGFKLTAGVAPTVPELGYMWIRNGTGLYLGMGTDSALTQGPFVDEEDVSALLVAGTKPGSFTTVGASGLVTAPAGTTAHASLYIPAGVAPDTLALGYVWTTASGLYISMGTTTDLVVGPLIDAAAANAEMASGNHPVSGTTGTFTGLVTAPAGTTARPSLSIPVGVAPSTFALGYVWVGADGLYVSGGTASQFVKGPVTDVATITALLAGGTLPISGSSVRSSLIAVSSVSPLGEDDATPNVDTCSVVRCWGKTGLTITDFETPSAVYAYRELTILGAYLNEQQTLTVANGSLTDSFTVTYSGQTTGSLNWDVSAPDMQTALQGLSNIGPGNALVSKVGAVFTVQFVNDLAETNVDEMTATPTDCDVTPATTVAGGGSNTSVVDDNVTLIDLDGSDWTMDGGHTLVLIFDWKKGIWRKLSSIPAA